MAAEAPNSFKDPYWSDLASKTEAKLDLPKGLLVSLLTKGERSNADQVSEVGARTPFQVTPETRNLVLKRDGIDAYLSPENAAEVAGLVAKDGVKWAQQRTQDADAIPRLAAGYYHAGGDTKNWGPKTLSYMARVTGGLAPADAPAPSTAAGAPGAMPDGSQSTFDRLGGVAAPAPTSQIQNIFAAYTAGKMSPEQAQAFEADVNSGKLLLPRGASLKGPDGAAPAVNDPTARIVTAFNDGRMSPEQAAAFQNDVKSGVFKVPTGMALRTPGTNVGIPDAVAPNGTPEAPQGVLDKIIGAGEAGLQAVTGATGGAAGFITGGAAGVAQDVAALAQGQQPTPGNVERLSQAGAQALTYAPRTPSGQEQGEAVNSAMQALIPVTPMTAELGALARGTAPLVRAGADAARAAPEIAQGVAAPLVERVRAAMPGGAEPAAPAGGTRGSVGAAAVHMADQRRAAAADLPVPVKLTKGQATRDFEQQQFERETSKAPDAGAPLREHVAQQNENVLKNFDAFVDQTGAESTSLRATGAAVDSALTKQFQADKAKVRVAYKNAEKAGEMESPVSTAGIVDAINDARSAESTAPVITAAKNELVRLGGASIGEDGLLVPNEMTLGNAEQVRKFVNKVTGIDPTNQKFAGDIKRAIDASTEGAGGQLYRAARAERQRLAQNYEDRAVVNKLLTEKRGTSDRAVALEDVFSHTMLDGALDDVRNVRRVLQRGGEEGQQAWRELQGQTVQYLKSEATKNVARDIRGNEIVSASGLDRAIKKLDADGKLDFVFGKRGAQQLRTMNDLAKDIYTSPPGSVNSSNTASIVLAALDMSLSGVVGLPLPVASGVRILASRIKDRRLAARVNEALSGAKPAPKPSIRPAPRPMTSPAATSRN